MKNFTLLFLLLISLNSSAQIIQDWDISPLGQVTYFERDNGFLEKSYNDSTEVFTDYRKHYFGEIYTRSVFASCETEIINFLDQVYYDYFFPTYDTYFAIEEWYSNDDYFYILNQTDTIKFHHKAPLNFSWTIPVTHNDFDEIKFECVQLTEEEVFGTMDSVRIFEMTTFQNGSPTNSEVNLRKIHLSKLHGFTTYTPFYRWVKGYISWTQNQEFNILGIEKNDEIKGLIPHFDLFFENYSVGDIFKWYYKSPINLQIGNSPFQRWHIDSIIDLSFYSDSLIEITYDRYTMTEEDEIYTCDTFLNQFISYKKSDFFGLFVTAPRFLFGGNSNGTSIDNPISIWQLESIQKIGNNQLEFKTKSIEWYNFNNCQEMFSDGWANQIHQTDLGLTFRYQAAITIDDQIELIGYRKGNVIVGDITPVCLLSSNNNISTKTTHSIQFFPNPTSEEINIKFSMENHAPYSFSIYNTFGQLMRSEENFISNSINLSSLEKGIYYLEIQSKDGYFVKKIVKQ